MAIAGSTLEAFRLILVGSTSSSTGEQLINQGSGRMVPHLVVKDPVKALAKLRKYKSVNLWKYGDNWVEFKRLFAESQQNNGNASTAAQDGQGGVVQGESGLFGAECDNGAVEAQRRLE